MAATWLLHAPGRIGRVQTKLSIEKPFVFRQAEIIPGCSLNDFSVKPRGPGTTPLRESLPMFRYSDLNGELGREMEIPLISKNRLLTRAARLAAGNH